MLGRYPLATAPLAVLAGGGQIIEADASATITATASFDSGATAGVDAASTTALTVSWDSLAIVSAETSTTLAATVAFDSAAIVAASSATTAELSTSWVSGATAGVDFSTTAALASTWEMSARQTIESEFSSAASVASTWELDARQYSTADMSTTLALSSAFDAARILPSAFSTVINPAVGPVQPPVAVVNPGSGYAVGNQLLIVGGNNDAVVTVMTRIGTGVQGLALTVAGSGYATGTYATTPITGTGSGCVVSFIADTAYVKWRSGATKGSVWSPVPKLTVTPRGAAFVLVSASASCALAVDAISGATAGVIWTADQAAQVIADGQRLVSRIIDTVNVQRDVIEWLSVARSLTDNVNVGRSIVEDVKVGE